ncbi:MAG TPA: SDR family NAD(P)-dependent oxidoreductase [Anaerolineales bacterium]|nr:SDR family NAD(P)-dependent oxidoreductase [Anaerolineales bacterium]
MNNPQTLLHKRALITGGSKGIGRAIALAFAQAGAQIALTSRTLADAQPVADEITAMGGTALPFACDVTDLDQIAAMRAALLEQWGGVDILVNNAGIAGSHKFLGHSDDLWHHILNVNLNGVYYVTKAFVPEMIGQQWGRIINIASVASKVGSKYTAAYTASKHGVLGLTRALAVELTPHITVNAICPGYVNTPMTDSAIANMITRTGMTPEQARGYLEKLNPQNRLIESDEVAAVALLLASESARGITGQAINVDGGAVMF